MATIVDNHHVRLFQQKITRLELLYQQYTQKRKKKPTTSSSSHVLLPDDQEEGNDQEEEDDDDDQVITVIPITAARGSKKKKRSREEKRKKKEKKDTPAKPLTREDAIQLIPEKKMIQNVVVTAQQRKDILSKMGHFLNDQQGIAARFRNSHTLHVSEPTKDLKFPRFEVLANTKSTIQCNICDIRIPNGVDRCKLELYFTLENLEQVINRRNLPRDEKVDFCVTHGYCVPCFAVYISTCLPGLTCVCFGTCRDRGGCRQPGTKLSSANRDDGEEEQNRRVERRKKKREKRATEDNGDHHHHHSAAAANSSSGQDQTVTPLLPTSST
jgi:hypothetical protein